MLLVTTDFTLEPLTNLEAYLLEHNIKFEEGSELRFFVFSDEPKGRWVEALQRLLKEAEMRELKCSFDGKSFIIPSLEEQVTAQFERLHQLRVKRLNSNKYYGGYFWRDYPIPFPEQLDKNPYISRFNPVLKVGEPKKGFKLRQVMKAGRHE